MVVNIWELIASKRKGKYYKENTVALNDLVHGKLLGLLGGLLMWSSLTFQLVKYYYLYKYDITW